MAEIPDSMDPLDEMPQTLDGMLDEILDHGRKLLKISDRILALTRVGQPDPVLHGILKLSEIVSLQTAAIAKLAEEVRELKEKGSL